MKIMGIRPKRMGKETVLRIVKRYVLADLPDRHHAHVTGLNILKSLFAVIEINVCLDAADRLCKINVDENPDLASIFSIFAIPTIIGFVDGQPKAKVEGAVPKENILALLQ